MVCKNGGPCLAWSTTCPKKPDHPNKDQNYLCLYYQWPNSEEELTNDKQSAWSKINESQGMQKP